MFLRRDDVACMMRVRNEARWIKRSLERTWAVVRRVVILDDGSTDDTFLQSMESIGISKMESVLIEHSGSWCVVTGNVPDGECELHYLHSPFRPSRVRDKQATNEIRDKNFLWEYCKSNVSFKHMLCLDGDEMLSLAALRGFPEAIQQLELGVDILNLPFVYLWDQENQRRVDGIYGPRVGFARLNFPRLFSICRVHEDVLFEMRFAWEGTKGGFHCGSIPRERFFIYGIAPHTGNVWLPIVHFGYLDVEERQRKFLFYNWIDPHNEFEGEYAHIIGQPDRHAPGPVELVPWEDR